MNWYSSQDGPKGSNTAENSLSDHPDLRKFKVVDVASKLVRSNPYRLDTYPWSAERGEEEISRGRIDLESCGSLKAVEWATLAAKMVIAVVTSALESDPTTLLMT